ncbi:MAG: MFS siderochrome iron transporter 1 [Alyxoria varia]|nr:MAG: MFS siderochrome iron transporter 1 [Alyxoria varia]
MEKSAGDVESLKPPQQIPHFKQGAITQSMIDAEYEGSGTEDDPYLVTWIDEDPRNPMRYSNLKKWTLVNIVAVATLAVAFVSSAYAGGVTQIIADFQCSNEVATLGISLFVLGFAIGPLLWAPMSELFGRQYLFIGTYAVMTFFNAGAAGSQNIWTLIILRFFAGAIGSSPLTNAGGVIADMFAAKERGMALSIFAAAPFLGPTLGPIVGGFVGETVGWRWIEGVMAIFTGVVWIFGTFFLPETYPPVLLRKRAQTLSKVTGKVYISRMDAQQGKVTISHAFRTSLLRPWILLFREPIVFLLSIYMAIVYGTLYMLFAAFPIVYQQGRGWSPGIGGLPFLGVMIGMLGAIAFALYDNKRYIRVVQNEPSGFAPPEARLPVVMWGALTIPIGLFWFAWTNSPSIHYMASISAGVPFGFGMVLIFLGIMNYLIDSYVIFAASVLAANSVMRSIFGAVFPLFTSYMYEGLGIHWASSVPAFLALACAPFPFVFYKYGPAIRRRCKFAAEADRFMQKMKSQTQGAPPPEKQPATTKKQSSESDHSTSAGSREEDIEKWAQHHHKQKQQEQQQQRRLQQDEQQEENKEQEAFDYSYDDHRSSRTYSATSPKNRDSYLPPLPGERSNAEPSSSASRFERIKTGGSMARVASSSSAVSNTGAYDESPYDIDRVNTKESFGGEGGRETPKGSAGNSRSASRERGGSRTQGKEREKSREASGSRGRNRSVRRKASSLFSGRSGKREKGKEPDSAGGSS